MAIRENQRGTLVGLRFAECLQGLLWVGAHRYLRDIDIAVGDGLQRKILARDALARGCEFGDRAQRRSLRSLAAGV